MTPSEERDELLTPLLSRVREEHDRTGDNSAAVVEGLAGTARVITAAAATMVAVFGSFALGDILDVKVIGVGLAAAVFVDATLVRCVLVRATIELLGERNWWLPSWLRRTSRVVLRVLRYRCSARWLILGGS